MTCQPFTCSSCTYYIIENTFAQITIPVQEGLEGFWTLCHGEPWFGNLSFRYDDKGGAAAPRGGLEGTTTKQKGANPAEAMFGGFHSYFIGKPGHDIALFLMTSTSRAFREEHLDHLLRAYLAELDDVIGSQGQQPLDQRVGSIAI